MDASRLFPLRSFYSYDIDRLEHAFARGNVKAMHDIISQHKRDKDDAEHIVRYLVLVTQGTDMKATLRAAIEDGRIDVVACLLDILREAEHPLCAYNAAVLAIETRQQRVLQYIADRWPADILGAAAGAGRADVLTAVGQCNIAISKWEQACDAAQSAQVLQSILKHAPRPLSAVYYQRALRDAAVADDVDALSSILRLLPRNVDLYPSLRTAVVHGHHGAFTMLIPWYGASQDELNELLSVAIEANAPSIILRLLELGANPCKRQSYNLRKAIENGCLMAMDVILQHPNFRSHPNHIRLLTVAARARHANTTERILAYLGPWLTLDKLEHAFLFAHEPAVLDIIAREMTFHRGGSVALAPIVAACSALPDALPPVLNALTCSWVHASYNPAIQKRMEHDVLAIVQGQLSIQDIGRYDQSDSM